MKTFGDKIIFLLAALLATGASALSPALAQTLPVTTAQEMPALDQLAQPAIPAPRPAVPALQLAAPALDGKEVLPAPVADMAAVGDVPAELALVKSAAPLDSPASSSKKAKTAKKKKKGGATETSAQKAVVAPAPKKVLVIRKDHNEDDFNARLTTARMALSRGRPAAAVELFNTLYASNPNNKQVLMGRAVALQQAGQGEEALEAYELVLNNDPKNIEALTNMLGILRNQDQASAVEQLMQLQEIYPYNADIAAQLGMVYGSTGDYQSAVKYLEMADALKPGNIGILYNRAVAYDHMGQMQRAAELYRQALLLAGEGTTDAGFPVDAVKRRLAAIH